MKVMNIHPIKYNSNKEMTSFTSLRSQQRHFRRGANKGIKAYNKINFYGTIPTKEFLARIAKVLEKGLNLKVKGNITTDTDKRLLKNVENIYDNVKASRNK